jgi:hypothetical protein
MFRMPRELAMARVPRWSHMDVSKYLLLLRLRSRLQDRFRDALYPTLYPIMMRTTQGRNEKDIVTLLTDRLNRWLLGGGHQCAMSWASWAHERVCAYMWNLRWINLKDSLLNSNSLR